MPFTRFVLFFFLYMFPFLLFISFSNVFSFIVLKLQILSKQSNLYHFTVSWWSDGTLLWV